MRLAFFTPLPPAKSGIADYSVVLLEHLRGLAEVDTFTEKPKSFGSWPTRMVTASPFM